ncbi:MAG: response regulator transcription factor [Acidobacteriota bacterium]
MKTVLIADDHAIVRQGLRALIDADKDFQLVGEADNGLEAVRLVENLKPNLLVVDLMMPGLNGLEVARQTKEISPVTRIVVLSMYSDEAYVLEALRKGATGYVLKDAQSTDLLKALHAVAGGHHYLSPPLSERAIEVYARKAGSATLDLFETLTKREREVLQLAAEGLSQNEIAQRLSISPRTSETHRANLMRKLGLQNQTELVRFAIRRGIVPLE